MLGRAERRLLTAAGGISFGDVEGGFAAAYDAYRRAAEGLLVRQGLRATGGDGSDMAVEDAISGQLGTHIAEFASRPSSGFGGPVTPRSTSIRRRRRSMSLTRAGRSPPPSSR